MPKTPILPALVELGRCIAEHQGMDALVAFEAHSHPCACMGPQGDEPLCPCAMQYALAANLLTVVNEIDPEAGLKLMRTRLVRSLRDTGGLPNTVGEV